MVKIAAIGLVTMFLGIVLGKMKPEYGLCVILGGSTLIFILGMQKVQEILETLEAIRRYAGIQPEYIKILLKILGIAYIAEFTSSLCKDAGQTAIAGQIDFASKVSMLVLSMPVLVSLLKMVGGLNE